MSHPDLSRTLLMSALLMALPGLCSASDGVVVTGAAPVAEEAGTRGPIEDARDAVRSSALWLARGIDSWFGDQPFEDGGKVSDGRLSVGVLQRQGESVDVNVRFNARFVLPNIERLTYVFVGNDDRREVLTDSPGALSRQDGLLTRSRESQSFFAGIGRDLSDLIDLRLGVRGRLNVYAQARFRHQWQLGAHTLADFKQTVFYSREDRLGSTTAASVERVVSPTLSVRWLGAATTTQSEPDLTWSSLLGIYRNFGGQRLLSLEALASGRQHSGTATTDQGIQARWEQPVYEDWLVGGVVVGRFWPRPDGASVREGVWALGANLQMRF